MTIESEPAWPRLVGDVVFGSADSPVAVCTLASRSLLQHLAGRAEIAIAGRVYTENVGLERMVQNLAANPRLRLLIVCGRESPHRVGQAIFRLHRHGLDEDRRIVGATGPEPFLPNLDDDEIRHFRQIELVDMIGELDPEKVLARARALAARPGPSGEISEPGRPADDRRADARAEPVERVQATADERAAWRYDPTGFFLIFVDRAARSLLAEHYSQDRRLLRVVVGTNAQEVCHTLVRLGLVSELAHAAYLGRELARAEAALRLGLHYEQDSPLDPRRRA